MVCDASVLVALIVPEPSSNSVDRALREADGATISDFVVGEVFSAIGIKLRRGEIAGQAADGLVFEFQLLAGRYGRKTAMQPEDMEQAAELVRRFEFGLRMPDALHIALAQRLALPLATLDKRQTDAARALGVPVPDFAQT